jgi:Heterokaryon incompatibility protein (HET)
MSSFNYSLMPIDSSKHEIRLIEILPSNGNPESTAPIPQGSKPSDEPLRPRVRCRMKRICLDDSPVYPALSYSWGDANDKRQIVLNDMEVSVNASLESALYHLRHRSATITLWADALCINQSDNGEKTEQVQQMKRIYQDASHVIVWLGPRGEDSDVAFDVMNQIGKKACDLGFWDIPRKSWLQPEHRSNESGPYARLHKFIEEEISLDHPFEAIARLTKRPWWYRVWVMQEFVLAKDIFLACGFSNIAYPHFAAAIISFITGRLKIMVKVQPEDWTDLIKGPKLRNFITNSMNSRPSNMIGARRVYHADPGSHETLIQLLLRANSVSSSLDNLHATNHRDKIFGMLGLASDTDQLDIRPDYSKSCQAVYTDVARNLLQHGHTDILALSQFPKRHPNLPTWVPDWTTTIQVPCGECVFDARFSASGQISVCSVPTVSPDADRLIALSGARVDIITQVGAQWLPTIEDYKHDWVQSITFISEIESFCDKSDRLARPIYKSLEQRKEAVWRIPCGDLARLSGTRRHRAHITSPDVLEGFKLLKEGFKSHEAGYSADTRLHSYMTSMGDMFKRRPFLSAQGYVGLAPSHAEVGDVIVIIYGAIVPFIVRDLGKGRFNFVGEAYVHGIMDGEYVEKGPPTETFILC